MRKIILSATVVATTIFTGCQIPADSNKQESVKQEQMKLQADQSVGMPSIVNWQEKRMAKDILELRDKQINTVTYTQDMNGKLHKICNSVGYGLPYSVQYTNPQKVVQNYSSSFGSLPQADPNGLYMPENAEGTWVMCKDKNSDKVAPVYMEPRIIVSPFELDVK